MTLRALAAALALAAVGAAPAYGADPGRWIVTSVTGIPNAYRQGLASDAGGDLFFSGPFAGIYKTRHLKEISANTSPIPPDVNQREQYNHIGDIAWDGGEGGRVLLPLESYQAFANDTNPSKTGSIGVMDSALLHWRYYVKLDPAEIQKAQWVATGAGGLAWTITRNDLLAYRLADINPANAAPGAAPIHSVRRLAGVIPGGAGGAAEIGGRLYMSTDGPGVERVVSVDLATGASRTEYERAGTLEPEGVDVGAYDGGILHVEFVAGLSRGKVLNLLPKGAALRLRLAHARVPAGRTTMRADVVAATGGYHVPLAKAEVRLAGARAKTDARGRARLRVSLTPGSYRVYAYYNGLRTGSARLRAG
jgi:hypothetical protein